MFVRESVAHSAGFSGFGPGPAPRRALGGSDSYSFGVADGDGTYRTAARSSTRKNQPKQMVVVGKPTVVTGPPDGSCGGTKWTMSGNSNTHAGRNGDSTSYA